jgi:hypothetical protein
MRVLYEDDTVEEYRITKPRQARDTSAGKNASLLAVGIYMDLANGIISRDEADGTVTLLYTLLSFTVDELVDEIIAHAPSYFAKGTINNSTDVVPSFTFDYDTPLKALTELAELNVLELATRRNGDTDYKVDLLTQIGSTAETPEFRFRKNLMGVTREIDASDLANKIYPAGGSDGAIRLGVGKSRWEATNVSGLVVTLAGDPIYVDDALNGYYVEDNVGVYQIQDCSYSAQTITLPSGHTVVQDELIWFRENAAGKELAFVEDPDSKATYGTVAATVEESDLPYTDNLVEDPSLSDWISTSENTHWEAYSTATVEQDTHIFYTKVGGASAHVTCTAAGQGIKTKAAISISPADPMIYFSGFIDLYVVSGVVEFWWSHSSEGRFPSEGVKEAAYTSVTDRWIQLSIEGKEFSSGNVHLYVTSKDGAAEFYLDDCQFTNTSGNYAFFDGRAANELWRRGLKALDDRANPRVVYDINVVDLTAVDATTWPYDAVTLGGDVLIYDEELSLNATVRAINLTRELLTGHNLRIQLSNRPDDIIDALTRTRRRRQVEPEVRPNFASIASFHATAKADGVVVLKLVGSGATRSFKFLVSPINMPTIAEVISSGTASNEVTGTVVEAGTGDWEEQGPTLGRGQRAYVRAVAFPLLGAAGVAGETDTEVAGPPTGSGAEITGTNVTQVGDGLDSGGASVKRTWIVNQATVSVRHFRRVGAYPTDTGHDTGTLDYSYDRGFVDVHDNFAYEDGGYTDETIYDIGVPYDLDGIAGESSAPSGYTVTAQSGGYSSGANPFPQFVITNRDDASDGTSCSLGSRRKVDLSWTTSDVTDTSHDVDIYYRLNNGGWHFGYTVTDPVTTQTYQHEAPMYKKKNGDLQSIDYRLELVAGSIIDDQSLLREELIFIGDICPE